MRSTDNWDDLRFVLEVAEAGSVAAAAGRLNVSVSTVVRRIAAAEVRFGTRIFERTASGYVVPPDSLATIAALREARAAIDQVARRLDGRQSSAGSRVRLTSTDTLCLTVLPGILTPLTAASPGLQVELLMSNTHLDFARLHADVAVRPAHELPPDMRGERAADLRFAAYETAGAPNRWIGYTGPVARTEAARWIESRGDVIARADSFPAAAALAATGLGRVLLPRVLAGLHPPLRPSEEPVPEISVPVWVACHADMADVPRLRRFRADLVAELSALDDRL